jgi:hypothetical protein
MEIGNKLIKLNWKFRIVSAILTGLLFIGIMCLMDYFLDGEFQSLNSYLFQGIFFGIFMGIGFPYVTQKFGTKFTSKIGKNIKPELAQDENIEIEGPANLFRGMEGVGGKLFLTNKKVVFKSHKINIQKGQTDILYENITEIIKRKTAKIIDNGIRIKTNGGNEFDFVVNEREKWIEKLNEKITHYNTVYNLLLASCVLTKVLPDFLGP